MQIVGKDEPGDSPYLFVRAVCVPFIGPVFLLQGGILVLVSAEVTHCEWAVKNLSNRDECSVQEIEERLSMPTRSMLLIHILH
jgi:hypothetical protein